MGDQQPREVDGGERRADDEADPQLLPQHLEEVGGPDVADGHAADDQRARLAARVAPRVGEHGDEGDEQRHGGEGGLITPEDAAGDHARNHEHEQPDDAGFSRG